MTNQNKKEFPIALFKFLKIISEISQEMPDGAYFQTLRYAASWWAKKHKLKQFCELDAVWAYANWKEQND